MVSPQSHLVLDERLLDAPGAGLDDADVAVLAGRDHVPVVHVEGERVHRPVGVVQRAVLRPVAQVEDLLEVGGVKLAENYSLLEQFIRAT